MGEGAAQCGHRRGFGKETEVRWGPEGGHQPGCVNTGGGARYLGGPEVGSSSWNSCPGYLGRLAASA